jgi:hypothetical protein
MTFSATSTHGIRFAAGTPFEPVPVKWTGLGKILFLDDGHIYSYGKINDL